MSMQDRVRLRAEQCREIALRFRRMAEIEPLASLRRHLPERVRATSPAKEKAAALRCRL